MILNTFVIFLLVVYCFEYAACAISDNEDPQVTETGAVINEEPRKKQENNLMSRILPMLATPFIMQVTILPLVLMGMKFMLLSSMFFGKLGVLLWIIHLVRNNNNLGGGLYSHNVNIEHNSHPAHWNSLKNYQYSEHYNRRRRRRHV